MVEHIVVTEFLLTVELSISEKLQCFSYKFKRAACVFVWVRVLMKFVSVWFKLELVTRRIRRALDRAEREDDSTVTCWGVNLHYHMNQQQGVMLSSLVDSVSLYIYCPLWLTGRPAISKMTVTSQRMGVFFSGCNVQLWSILLNLIRCAVL